MKKMLQFHHMALILSLKSLNASSSNADLRQFGLLALVVGLDQEEFVSRSPTWDAPLALRGNGKVA
jgi:hypothetical protein